MPRHASRFVCGTRLLRRGFGGQVGAAFAFAFGFLFAFALGFARRGGRPNGSIGSASVFARPLDRVALLELVLFTEFLLRWTEVAPQE